MNILLAALALLCAAPVHAGRALAPVDPVWTRALRSYLRSPAAARSLSPMLLHRLKYVDPTKAPKAYAPLVHQLMDRGVTVADVEFPEDGFENQMRESAEEAAEKTRVEAWLTVEANGADGLLALNSMQADVYMEPTELGYLQTKLINAQKTVDTVNKMWEMRTIENPAPVQAQADEKPAVVQLRPSEPAQDSPKLEPAAPASHAAPAPSGRTAAVRTFGSRMILFGMITSFMGAMTFWPVAVGGAGLALAGAAVWGAAALAARRKPGVADMTIPASGIGMVVGALVGVGLSPSGWEPIGGFLGMAAAVAGVVGVGWLLGASSPGRARGRKVSGKSAWSGGRGRRRL